MADSEQEKATEAFANFWQQSQEALLNAQREIGEQLQASLMEMTGTVEREASDPIEAWKNLIKVWVPDWDDTKPSQQDFSPNFGFEPAQTDFMQWLNAENWTKHTPDQLKKLLENIAQVPQFADLAMPQKDAANTWKETIDYQQAAVDLSRIIQDAWTSAYEAFSKSHSIEDLQKGETNQAMNAWLKAANHALLTAQRSADFLDAQKRIIRASTEIRARQKEVAEQWSANWQMPTRTEFDDLSRTVHELRRELREVKRELRRLKE